MGGCCSHDPAAERTAGAAPQRGRACDKLGRLIPHPGTGAALAAFLELAGRAGDPRDIGTATGCMLGCKRGRPHAYGEPRVMRHPSTTIGFIHTVQTVMTPVYYFRVPGGDLYCAWYAKKRGNLAAALAYAPVKRTWEGPPKSTREAVHRYLAYTDRHLRPHTLVASHEDERGGYYLP